MNIVVTGGSGFVGRFLVEQLRATRPQAKLISIDRAKRDTANVEHVSLDLTKKDAVADFLARALPAEVYHLAGIARTTTGIGLPEYFEQNTLTTLALLNGLQAAGGTPRFFLASSVHVYGNTTAEVAEDSPAAPVSEYGFSKYLAEEAVRERVATWPGLRAIIGRFYNCIGPGQAEGFVVSDLCRRIRELPKAGGRLVTGSLHSVRNFTDVRDAVSFPPALMANNRLDRLEVFNFASPEYHSIEELAHELLRLSGKAAALETRETFAASQFKGLKVSTKKLSEKLKPRFRPWETTLRDALDVPQN